MTGPRDEVIMGKLRTVYPVTYLAKRLGRTVPTIRRWERDGVLPKSRVRLSHNWRYYLYEEVDVAVDIAMQEGLLQGRAISTTNFTARICEAWDNIWIEMEDEYGKSYGNRLVDEGTGS